MLEKREEKREAVGAIRQASFLFSERTENPEKLLTNTIIWCIMI